MSEPKTQGGRWKRANPEKAREANRRANAKRPDRPRHDYVPCERCGGPRAARSSKSGLCRECWMEEVRAPAEELWAQGKSIREMAEILGRTPGGMNSSIQRWRKYGGAFPRRYAERKR